jgi:hypothetical protein
MKNGASKAMNRANNEWKVLIGSKRQTVSGTGQQLGCECTRREQGNVVGIDFHPGVIDCDALGTTSGSGYDYDCVPVSVFQVTSTEEPSDGIVPVSSQVAFPGARVGLMRNMPPMNIMKVRPIRNNKGCFGESAGLIFEDTTVCGCFSWKS